MIAIRTVLLLILVAVPLLAGGKKEGAAGIAFHLETNPGDNPKMIFTQFVAGRERVFRRVPEIGPTDIAAFNPFPSKDGEGYGVLLKLKGAPSTRLGAITTANQGRWMIARVNGRIVDGVLIDKPITDGEMVIWKGIALAEINELDKRIPRIGERKPRG